MPLTFALIVSCYYFGKCFQHTIENFRTKINAGYILKNIYLILFQIPPENAEHKQLFFLIKV